MPSQENDGQRRNTPAWHDFSSGPRATGFHLIGKVVDRLFEKTVRYGLLRCCSWQLSGYWRTSAAFCPSSSIFNASAFGDEHLTLLMVAVPA